MGEKMTTFIKEYRKKCKMSQAELASKVGVCRETIGRLEKASITHPLNLQWILPLHSKQRLRMYSNSTRWISPEQNNT